MEVPDHGTTILGERPGLAVVWLTACLLATLGVTGGVGEPSVAAPVLLVGLTGRHNLLGLLGWIAAGAIAGGVVLYAVGTVLVPDVSLELLVGFGVAVGGGLTGVVRLIGFGEQDSASAETITFTRGGEDSAPSSPDPRPADLFDASPEPILYYDDAGDGPVVRAVNPAFESAFGVSSPAVEDAALADSLMVTADADEIVAAAASGDAYAGTVTCETATGQREYAIRLASVSDDAGTRGYVLYTAVRAGE